MADTSLQVDVAIIGGGEQGSTTLARGLQRLCDIASGFVIFKRLHSAQQPTPSKRPFPSQKD